MLPEDLVAPGPEYYGKNELVLIASHFQHLYESTDPKTGKRQGICWGYVVSDGVDANGNIEIQTGRKQRTVIPWRHAAVVRINNRESVCFRGDAFKKYGFKKNPRSMKFVKDQHDHSDSRWDNSNISEELFALQLRYGIVVQQKDVVRSNMNAVMFRQNEYDWQGYYDYLGWYSNRRLLKMHNRPRKN